MSRVLISKSTGASVYVFSDDHCPPHVHARHRADGWIARVRFSYLGDAIVLLSIAPLKNVPLPRTVNHLLTDIAAELEKCRRSWWMKRQTTCLTNQFVAIDAAGAIEPRSEPSGDAKRIANAMYSPEKSCLSILFHDGTTMDVSV